MKDDEYNAAKQQIYYICELLDTQKWIEIKVKCLWCEEYSLLLKEKGQHYWCLNCGAEGPLDEVEHILLRKLMEQKPEVGRGSVG